MAFSERIWKHKALLAVSLESKAGVQIAPSPTGNGMMVRDLEVTPLAGDVLDRELLLHSMGRSGIPPVYARRHTRIQFSVGLEASGTPATPPCWGVLMRGCGMSETIARTADPKQITYAPVSAPVQHKNAVLDDDETAGVDETAAVVGYETLTIVYSYSGQSQIIKGCRGNWSLEASANQIPLLKFDFIGAYIEPSYYVTDGGTSPICKPGVACGHGNAADLFGQAVLLSSLSVDYGQEVVFNPLIGTSDDNNLPQIIDRAPSAQFECLADKPTTFNLIKRVARTNSADPPGADEGTRTFAAGTTGLNVQFGASVGRRIKLRMPGAHLVEPSYGEVDKQLTISGTLLALPKLDKGFTHANTEISLAIT